MLSASPNPPPVETFYLPVPAASVLQALQTIHTGPKAPVSTYTSITVAEDGTLIYYDQWENGYIPDIANPTPAEMYNSVTNPGGVQIWGDGNPADGAPPGYPDNVLHAGDVIILASPSISVPRNPAQIYFDGGDKIAATKSIAIGMLDWAAGTGTLMSGSLEVDPVSDWGTSYKVPIGQNTANSGPMFNYTGLSIMAAKDGTTVQIDATGTGTSIKTIVLNQGQNYLVNNGVKQGATVVSTDPSKPIQVDILTGTPSQTYASRWFTLAPVDRWSTSYYTPVSTRSTNPTVVFLYNPSSSPLAITAATRGSGGAAANLTTTTLMVPAEGTAKMTIPEGSGAHFYTAGNQPFYAVSTMDFGSFNYEWGMTLIPQDQLTTQALVGLGLGRDPTSTVNPTQNGSPVWVTPTGNGNTPVTVYVSYNGNDTGPLIDPNGYHYDVALSLKELQTAKVFNPDGNQTGMLLYTLDPKVKLAVAWGEDPASASFGEPGLDAGTSIPPLPEFDASKSAALFIDANGDGVVSPSDTLLYTIVVNNISRTTLADLQLTDNLPADLSYVGGTLSYTITPHDGTASSPVSIPDTGTTTFALLGSGFDLPTLAGGATFTATFEATIANTLPTGLTDIINTGMVDSPSLNESVPLQSDTPVKYDIGGLVFEDLNRNGAVDPGEPGLAGVDVNLLSGTTIIASATTDASGHYRFIAPTPGNYTVNVVNSSVEAVLPNSAQTAGINPSPVSVTGGGALTDAGIDGYMTLVSAIPSRVGGRVTLDGVGLAGVSMTLTGTTAQDAIAPLTATAPLTVLTDANGNYSFTVMTGTYTISETLPAGLLAGPNSAGDFGGTVAPLPGTRISGIVVPGDAVGTNYNFTDLNPSSITGFVYADANNNGVFDSGEAAIGGVKMTLTGTNDLGAITPLTTTTASDGSYTFGMLRPGAYTITETQPAGYLNGLESKDGAVIPGSTSTNAIGGITLSEGGTSTDLFGELPPASITGYVYVDANDNGIKDAGEAAISGVQLTLTGSNDLGAITPLTITSGTDGSYTFGNLRPGTYSVTETPPTGYLNGLDAKDGAVIPGSMTTNAIGGISLSAGGASSDLFGELLPAAITGFVYVDANNNGLKDAGEAPLSGVQLTLTGTNDLGATISMTTTTATDGSYTFTTLRPGAYTITETPPAGYLNGLEARNGVVIPGSNTTDAVTGITLISGGSATVTFGELVIPPSIAIVKTGPLMAVAGSALTYQYTVTDTSPVPLSNVTVMDNKTGAAHYVSGDTNNNDTLDPGETWTFAATYTPSFTASSPLTNIATASGSYAGQTATATASYTLNPFILNKDLYLYYAGSSSTFNVHYGVKDTTSFTVQVSKGGMAIGQVQISEAAPLDLWLSNGSYTFTEINLPQGYIPVTGSITYSTGQGSNNQTMINVPTFDLAVVKSGPATATPGQLITYNFTVTNSGPAAVKPVLTDILTGPPTYVSGDTNHDGLIEPGETWTFTSPYTIPPLFTCTPRCGSAPQGGGGSQSPQTITNTVTVDAAENPHAPAGVNLIGGDTNPANNTSKWTTTVLQPTPLARGMTATIGFWHNNNGQKLINSLNGGSSSTALGNWLATTFPHMYGALAGANNLAGDTNSQIASFYLSQFNVTGQKLNAQYLAVALAVYSTNTALAGGTFAAQYGFTINTTGTGAATYNVGSNGQAFGLPNNTSATVLNLLLATDARAVNGVLYNGNTALRNMANTVFDGINSGGDIS